VTNIKTSQGTQPATDKRDFAIIIWSGVLKSIGDQNVKLIGRRGGVRSFKNACSRKCNCKTS